MKNIKNYVLILAILSLTTKILPLRGRVAAFAVGTSVGRNNSNASYIDPTVNKQIKRHELAIAKNDKKLRNKNISPEEKNDLRALNKEHEAAIQDLVKQ